MQILEFIKFTVTLYFPVLLLIFLAFWLRNWDYLSLQVITELTTQSPLLDMQASKNNSTVMKAVIFSSSIFTQTFCSVYG